MIITIIIINVKSFLKSHFGGISINSFMKKSCTAYNNSPMHCNDRQVLRDLFSIINRGNDKEMILMAGATEFNLKNLKT